MRSGLATAILVAVLSAPTSSVAAQAAPPYSGTIFLDPDIVTPSDPSLYQSAAYTGRGIRNVFDRRFNAFISIKAYLFDLAFSDGTTVEAQVNPEFGSEASARAEAETYGQYVGQLPGLLRRDVDALWIHRGTEFFGGGNRSILIHTGRAGLYLQDGILEETLIHEAAHTSLDADHAWALGWLAAQNADPTFVSTYARVNPRREDIAESFLPYLAVTYRRDRISQDYYDTVTSAIPNRIAYFDAQDFDLASFAVDVPVESTPAGPGLALFVTPNPVAASASIRLTLDRPRAVRVDVIDMLGRRVAEVMTGPLPAGETTLRWVSGAVAPGSYLCRVVGDGVFETLPVTVVR